MRPAACLMLALLLLGGCSDETRPPDDGPPPLGSVSVITKDSEIRLPLDYFSPHPRDADDIVRAEEYRARECMRGFGLTYPIRPQKQASYPGVVHPGLFGLIDPGLVKHGYGPVLAPDGWDEPTTPVQSRPPSAVEDAVWTGKLTEYEGDKVPQGGCLAEGRRKLGGTADLYWPKNELQAEAVKLAEKDPRTADVTRSWSACMKDAGYAYASPGDAASDARWLVPGPPSPAEVSAAAADVGCKTQVNYAGMRTAILTAYERRLVRLHKARLTTHKLELTKRLRHAEELISRVDVDAL
ncbi:hypothetical protein [Actinocorallia sp. A-T 12471]|uniref:hypothetical protein n=1 Tax=Actinocorallia sp. A-T 12471 TaxID=3089813 RepID=UPI0029D3212E|nr:hypothetical protein [Actinocorallia sp. A-T 12471]MDX6742480.1 hypothetical protein [Actinocorallia sp. A-T 12471]